MPLEPVTGGGWRTILARLADLEERYGTVEVVLGLPLSASGRPTELCAEVERLAEFLRERGMAVSMQSETGSTAEARSAGSRDRRDGRLDSAAAVILLKRFLHIP